MQRGVDLRRGPLIGFLLLSLRQELFMKRAAVGSGKLALCLDDGIHGFAQLAVNIRLIGVPDLEVGWVLRDPVGAHPGNRFAGHVLGEI